MAITVQHTPSDAVAWTQAIITGVGITIAAGVGIWQAWKQHKNAEKRQEVDRVKHLWQTANALAELVESCVNIMTVLRRSLGSRETVYDFAESQKKEFALGELRSLCERVAAVPLHDCAAELVKPVLNLDSVLRQFLEKVERVLNIHRNMDAAQFSDFFQTLAEMEQSLSKTATDFYRERSRLKAQLDAIR